ncbi:putative RING-H2 finger protein ATL21A isoform X2 [Beta vulgaris subsp. vulgaris]|uniref:putative RING-H2 finger protein ATL21A isoform X2 n=1 Tax=Beta vulgaris subsp. vulgaris TaxID=3555 RepID=UPI002037300E|nr:putative RING-H2 finger protein ATL21A isoform X2 [Beta vulgaris subsp. vulgaris]
MKNSSKLIIFPLISLHILLCMSKMSCAESCNTLICESLYIKFPFRLIDQQIKSCGSPGFDLYCDDKLGPLLTLPNAGNFTVDYILYYSREIEISDPNNCLPQKLLSLDLTTTHPFLPIISPSTDFHVYNCSGVGLDYDLYDEIDCLKGLNYTIISVNPGATFNDSNCKLLKIVSIPDKYALFRPLSSYSSIDLTWDEQNCESCGFTWKTPPTTYRSSLGSNFSWLALAALVVPLSFMLVCICCICRAQLAGSDSEAPIVATSNTNQAISGGLDTITINSYPMVVVGESGRLIKSDDDKCSICLSDYHPGDTLKILPECLHRFHDDCIDLWLSSKASCPICRTCPPQNG